MPSLNRRLACLVLIWALALTACGGSDDPAEEQADDSSTAYTPDAGSTSAATESTMDLPTTLNRDDYERRRDQLDALPERIIPRVEPHERMSFSSPEDAREQFIDAIKNGEQALADKILASVNQSERSALLFAMPVAEGVAYDDALASGDYAIVHRFERYLKFDAFQFWQLDGEYVRGRVTDSQTGLAVAGANVRVQDPYATKATTDTNGNFELLVPPQGMAFFVSHPGYDEQLVFETADGRRVTPSELQGETIDIALVSTNPVERPDLPSLTFRGRVVDASSGEPLTGVAVVASFDPIDGATETNLGLVMGKFGRETDADGRFEITDLPLQTVNLMALATIDNKIYQLKQQDFAFEEGVEHVFEVDGRGIKLDFPMVVVGYVKDRATGQPIPGARVSAGGWKAERTGERGQFLIQLDTGKDWQLTASHEEYHQSQPQPFSSPEPKKIETEFLLDPITTGTILGTAINAATGEPIANAIIEIAGQKVRTDARGRFKAEEIESGEITVSASQSGFRADREALLLEALQTAEATLELEPITTGTITGIIVDANGGAAIAGVLVRAGDSQATTGDDGRFVLEEVEAGTPQVAANKSLYVPGTADVTLEAMASVDTRIELAAITWGTVRGSVRDATTGQPLAGAAVRIGAIEATTDSDGTFVAERVPAGKVSVVASQARYRDAQAGVDLPRDGDVETALKLDPITTGTVYVTVLDATSNAPIAGADVVIGTRRETTDAEGRIVTREVPAGRVVANASANLYEPGSAETSLEAADEAAVEIKLVPITYGTVAGIVVNKASGAPVADVTVSIAGRQLRTKSDGTFRAERVPAGSVPVSAQLLRYRGDQQTVALKRGTEQDVRLQLDPITTGTVRGVVRNASTGKPVPGASITIGNLSAKSNAEGRFEIEQVAAGDATVQASARLFEPGESRINVEAADIVETQITITPITYGTISGTAVNAENGAPINDAQISAGRQTVRTDARGRFELQRVAAGDVSVVASKAIFINDSKTVALAAGASESVTLRLQPITWGVVTGIVTDADTGRPLANADIVVGTQSLKSDADGRFRAEKVAAGTLRIGASRAAYESASLSAELAADGERDVALKLQPIKVGDVSGQVVDAKTGEPIAQARVTVGREAAETDASGRFTFDDVDIGRVVIAARHPDYANGSAPADVPPADTVDVTIRLDLRREDVTSLESELAESGTIDLYGIYFDSGKAQFKPSSLSTLRAVLEVMKRAPDRRFRIAGHTDSDGGDDYNQDLSERRAGTVIQWLVDNGIDASRLDGAGFGETRPAAPNDTESGKALNRRVQLSFADER